MVVKTELGYKCSICGMYHPRDTEALSCEQSHDTIYVAINRKDLFNLLQYLYTKDEKLLTKSLMETLMKYRKGYYL